MTVGIEKGHDASSYGETGSLDLGERNMAWVVGRRPVEDREGPG